MNKQKIYIYIVLFVAAASSVAYNIVSNFSTKERNAIIKPYLRWRYIHHIKKKTVPSQGTPTHLIAQNIHTFASYTHFEFLKF
jgi:hypothetical protein